MQKVIDRLNKTCKAYGMEITVKKTKVMIMNGTGKTEEDTAVYNVEQGAFGAGVSF